MDVDILADLYADKDENMSKCKRRSRMLFSELELIIRTGKARKVRGVVLEGFAEIRRKYAEAWVYILSKDVERVSAIR